MDFLFEKLTFDNQRKCNNHLMNANSLIKKLQLQAHPEGGFYRETYRSELSMTTSNGNVRNVCTAIYFLLENENKSCFHRIQSDESWFFHQGECLEIVSLQNGELATTWLGNNIEQGEVPQTIVPANTWFACKIKSASGYALVSCIVAPGFDFADFELANRDNLVQEYPDQLAVIEEFTR
jgi:predicted cupin superfamily sugar epimerase